MWWLLVLPAMWIGKKIVDGFQEKPTPARSGAASPPGPPELEERGQLLGSKIVVIGRTGAGKSSLINMLSGRNSLAVGPVVSTTRWVEGVPIEIGDREAILVDTPGYGEVSTSSDYLIGLVNWLDRNRASVVMVLLVLQADAKAYADDYRILQRVRSIGDQLPVIVILNHADKILPSRQPLDCSWCVENAADTLKGRHILQKVEEVQSQFEIARSCIAPSVCVDHGFNRDGLLSLIRDYLTGRSV